MKRITNLLLLVVCHFFCNATVEGRLPEEPWRALSLMEKENNALHWKGEITVKLFGNYSKDDSLVVCNTMALINKHCETIHLSFTDMDKANFEIIIADSTTASAYDKILQFNDHVSFYGPQYVYRRVPFVLFEYQLYLNKDKLEPDQSFEHVLANKMIFALYPQFMRSDYQWEHGEVVRDFPKSVFSPYGKRMKGKTVLVYLNAPSEQDLLPVSSFDLALLKEVYSTDYRTKLVEAKKIYYHSPSWIKQHIYTLLSIPFLLFVVGFIVLKRMIYKQLVRVVHNKTLLFNLIAAFVLLGCGGLLSLFYCSKSMISDPYYWSFNQMSDFVISTVALLLIVLPILNLFRITEQWIYRLVINKFGRIIIVFLSTSLLPSLIVLVFYLVQRELRPELFWSHDAYSPHTLVMYFVPTFIVIGITRALISFFILKEKEMELGHQMKLSELRELKTRAELNALHSKINPHFLYNSLNSIAGLSHIDANKTDAMALSLSKLFRYAINKEQSDWATLEEEMDMAKIYLDIEKVRFSERLQFQISYDEAISKTRIPRFIIQPLVENAIKHGIAKNSKEGVVTVKANEIDTGLELIVEDNGPHFASELEFGFGIQGIYDKLEILYPNQFELYIHNEPSKHILIKLNKHETIENDIN